MSVIEQCAGAYNLWSEQAPWESYASQSQNDIAEDAFSAGWQAALTTLAANIDEGALEAVYDEVNQFYNEDEFMTMKNMGRVVQFYLNNVSKE